jgi:hypothetical protein
MYTASPLLGGFNMPRRSPKQQADDLVELRRELIKQNPAAAALVKSLEHLVTEDQLIGAIDDEPREK